MPRVGDGGRAQAEAAGLKRRARPSNGIVFLVHRDARFVQRRWQSLPVRSREPHIHRMKVIVPCRRCTSGAIALHPLGQRNGRSSRSAADTV